MRHAVGVLGVAVLFAAWGVGSGGAALGSRDVTVYAVSSGVEFINTADDRQRGVNNNPFGAGTSKLRAKVADAGSGPFPGDVAVYSFDLFASTNLKQSAGSASYTCYFNYAKHALCKAYYELRGGSTVLAAGPVDFSATGFHLVVTGGTRKYLTASGEVRAAPAVRNAQRIDLTFEPATATPRAGRQLDVYAALGTAQFMNHADDRVRGMTTNPFNVDEKALRLVIVTNGKEKGNGPFPGDDILYTFKLYTSPSLEKRAGSAIFTCYYNFAKRALCDSYFDLPGGLILSSGPVVFNSKRFVMSVSGGTNEYLNVRGAMTATPAAHNLEHLDVKLVR